MRKVSSTNSINEQQMLEHCGMSYTLSLIGGRWKVGILWALSVAPMRFKDLRQRMTVISDRMLAMQLKELEKDGMIRRIVYPAFPPRVEYELTEQAMTLKPVMRALSDWGNIQKELKGLTVTDAAGQLQNLQEAKAQLLKL